MICGARAATVCCVACVAVAGRLRSYCTAALLQNAEAMKQCTMYSTVNVPLYRYNIMFVKLFVLILAILSIAAAADLEEVTHRVYFDIEIDGR